MYCCHSLLEQNLLANQIHAHYTVTYTPQIWDRSTLQLLTVLEGHNKGVNCLQYNDEVIMSGSDDHTVKLVHPCTASSSLHDVLAYVIIVTCRGYVYHVHNVYADMTTCS